jgi:hypothetical protein
MGGRRYKSTYIITILSIEIPWFREIDMRISDDTRVMEIVGCMGMREETVGDEDVSCLSDDLGEFGCLFGIFAVGVECGVGVGRIHTFGMAV